jgi:hypothetical protein
MIHISCIIFQVWLKVWFNHFFITKTTQHTSLGTAKTSKGKNQVQNDHEYTSSEL